jgi:hypothetical protein
MTREKLGLTGQILIILTNTQTGKKRIIEGNNIVTNGGDKYYAQMACGETPDDDFDAAGAGIRLGTGFTSADKDDTDVDTEDSAGRLDVDSGYPKTNDDDGDNSGAGTDIVTWRFSYTTGEGNIADIDELAIVDNRTTPTNALCHAEISPAFTKTSSDTLKIFVNHTFNGT